MKLSEYLVKMGKLVKEHPEALDLPVVYSKDDEGNSFQEVNFDPTLGKWEVEREEIHAVCLN